MSADEIHGANELMMERNEAEFATLKRLEGLVTAAEGTFVGAASAKELDPSATTDALSAENEAAENAQVRWAQPDLAPSHSEALHGPPTWTLPSCEETWLVACDCSLLPSSRKQLATIIWRLHFQYHPQSDN